MKPLIGKILTASLAAALCVARPSFAEDIDLFTTANTTGSASAPNILIILDNSANWARNDQQWAVGKQGQAELYAIRQVLLDDNNFKTPVNMGLMMFTSGSPDGGYVRFAIRTMDATTSAGIANRQALATQIGTDTDPNFGGVACTAGTNSVSGTPNCILANFNGSEKTNSASTNYGGALMDAFKYFGGYTDPAHANSDTAGTPTNSTHFGQIKYSSLVASITDPASYTTSGGTTSYVSPLTTADSCAKNYIIFIGNGYPSQDVASTLLAGINGDVTTPAPIGNKSNLAANWAKYLNTTDVSSILGRQYVTTYAIDVFNAHPDTYMTPLMQAMAKYGGGQYFAAKNNNAILQAFKDILVQIQSVNSVFASASLPINATNRTQNENQVFIGMFRPDPKAQPRWYGNLKEYQIAMFGADARLADSLGQQAVSASTGFVQPCAVSFWTTNSGNYWSFSGPSAGTCTTVANSALSDYPDGGIVEKGGVAEVIRRGNISTATAPFVVNRTMLTCASSPCSSVVTFNATNVPAARTGAPDAATNTNIINFTLGQDVLDENADANVTEPRPSLHGDLVHSRPLPVNFGGSRGVELYYGSNDGTYRAVSGGTGQERWSFIAPEHHSKLKRLYDNAPLINYSGLVAGITPTPTSKDYFFDGSTGVYQNADNSKVWIFPSMRRGGRMVYAFDVSASGSPVFKWSVGCPNMTDDTGCTSGMTQIGQTWSTPSVAFVKGYSTTNPIVVFGGGYDPCEDTDAAVNTCNTGSKGNKVFVLDASSGAIQATFSTDRPVASDATFIDRDFDGNADHAYVLDVEGGLYRIDFIDPATFAARDKSTWTITKIANTTGAYRKFLFAPSALAALGKVYLAFGSGDRERPLITNYPYTTPVQNRFYMFIDNFATSGLPINLDGGSMANFTATTDCSTTLDSSKTGWFMDLTAGRGEQSVTSSVIFGGTIFFSTNRPLASAPGTCSANLGEARGYAVNLLTASGVIGTGATCGGSRSGVFTGGGIPPSPVVGTVPVTQADGSQKAISVLIGGIDLATGGGSPISAQKPNVPIQAIRQRMYWYPAFDK
ncbi:MAG TPA: PilC/PilY family type IV pilus protein [Usitatibacter sp.]|nr:PilC/PilY family type IV pilus protein [Usitatibacter sp.]